ncbi:PAS domain S-box protein [Sneathiella sp. P13V-1]|uniref:PAS domain S-box protein n=1 Tax=Sneathiella sp. P13V-1 TaxID=2697366 RepID=UPI00187BBF97|nr:PAS domain S-box protein [Sneathiella sp. P13V-1]MBE7636372.1 PAS domain S-box protein [Sneathiella sp. P13V-1]
MTVHSMDWDAVIGSLVWSKGSLATKFQNFKDILIQELKITAAELYVRHESGTYFRPVHFQQHLSMIGLRLLARPDQDPIAWYFTPTKEKHIFPEADVSEDYLALVTQSPSGQENGLILIGHKSGMAKSLLDQISGCFAELLRKSFGRLIDSENTAQKNNIQHSETDKYLTASMEATNDSFIIYDDKDRVVAYSPQQLEYYPWMRGHLKPGVHFNDLAQIAAFSGSMPSVQGHEDKWITEREKLHRGEIPHLDVELEDGRNIRIKDSKLPTGGWVASLTDITPFRKKEQDLKNKEQRFRHLLEASPDAISILQDGKIAYVNQQVLSLFGASDEMEMIKIPYRDYVHPDDIDFVTSQINDHVFDDRLRFNCRLKRIDGTYFYADVTYGPVEWKEHKAAIFTIRDISETRELLEKLEFQKAQLASAQTLFEAGHWIFDLKNLHFTPSDELRQILGINHQSSAIPLDEFKEMFPEGEYEPILQVYRDGIEARTPFDFEHRMIVDGKEKFIQGRAEVQVDEHGNAVSVFGMSRDVTERKKLEDLLRINEKRFKDLTLFSSDIYWETDADGYFTYISDDVDSFVGHSKNWYFDKTIRSIFSEEEQQNPGISVFLNAIDEKRAYRDAEFPRFHKKTGKKHWFTTSGIPIYDPQGNFAGFRGCNTDITHKVDLEERVKQAQKMEAVGNLSGGIAHDFNNLLGIILGNAEMLQEDLADLKQGALSAKTENIIKAASRGAELTHQMLAYSQKQPLAPKKIKISDQVETMMSMIHRTLGADIDIIVEHAPDLKETVVDPNQVENSVLNLCLNSRDAMPSGGTLKVKTQNCSITEENSETYKLPIGHYVCLKVEDNGAGIPLDIQERIFDPFFTTKEVGKGSGLGLSMIMGFAKQSGGNIGIKSAENEGTIISVYLPAVD